MIALMKSKLESEEIPRIRGCLALNCSIRGFAVLLAMALWFNTAANSLEEGSEKESSELVVATQDGDVQGFREQDVLHFRGLPYAQPPIGELRFRAPQAPEKWSGVRDATQYPNRCVQQPGGLLGQPKGAVNEDCLYLNVVTPSTEGANRPVMFWIHGGGFTQGSANGYNGAMLAEGGDVVVVAINYRLGLTGFLDLSSFGEVFASSANNGILDQVQALRWVQNNIALFGGDPNNVTIFGESAGGAAVLTLLATPAADGLYHKAIAHSPGGVDAPNVDPTDTLVEKLETPRELILEKLNGLGNAELLALQSDMGDVNVGPVIDNEVVTRTPVEAIKERGEQGVPLIAGTNRDEGTFFSGLFRLFGASADLPTDGMARAVTGGSDPEPFLAALQEEYPDADELIILERIFDVMFLKSSIESVTQASMSGRGGWLYRFDYATTEPIFGANLGATHAAEIPFTFNRFKSPTTEQIPGYKPTDSVAAALAQKWSDTLIQFAKTGNPNGAGLPEWPKYDAVARKTMVLHAEPQIETDLNRNLRDLWERTVVVD